MRATLPILAVLALACMPAAQACVDKSYAPVVELRINHPVIASPDGDSTYLVAVDAGGCVKLHFPIYDTRAGTYAYRLAPEEFGQLQRELRASGIAGFDPAAVKADLQARERAKAGLEAEGYAVRDEEILEFVVTDAATGAKGNARHEFLWTGLREQLLNHPDQGALIGVAAVRDRLGQLADDQRKMRVQP